MTVQSFLNPQMQGALSNNTVKMQSDIDLRNDNELKDLKSESKLVKKDVEIAKLTAEKALLKN